MHPAVGGVAATRFRAGGVYCRANVLRWLPRDACGTTVAAGNGTDGKDSDNDDDDDQRGTGDPPANRRLLLLNLLIVRVGAAVALPVRRLTRLAVSRLSCLTVCSLSGLTVRGLASLATLRRRTSSYQALGWRRCAWIGRGCSGPSLAIPVPKEP